LSVAIKADSEIRELAWQVEHRRQAVLEVLGGASVAEVAVQYGASKQSIYNWKARFELEGLPVCRTAPGDPSTVRGGCRPSWNRWCAS
jgi:transposase